MTQRRFARDGLLLLTLAACTACDTEPSAPADAPSAPTAVKELENETAPTLERPLAVGETLFDFTALAHTGQRFRFGHFLDKPCVIYFCAEDGAEACTQLALAIRDQWLLLRPQIGMVFGVSTEPTIVHREFAFEHKLPHLLLADADQQVHRVMGQKPGALVSYLIDPERKVLKVFSPPNLAAHPQEILAALKELELLRPAPPI